MLSGRTQSRLPCTESKCNKTFQSPETLRHHKSRHRLPRQYPCRHGSCIYGTNVEKYFKTNRERTDHEKTHQNQALFPCPICGKRCSRKSNRKRHIKRKHEDYNLRLPCIFRQTGNDAIQHWNPCPICFFGSNSTAT